MSSDTIYLTVMAAVELALVGGTLYALNNLVGNPDTRGWNPRCNHNYSHAPMVYVFHPPPAGYELVFSDVYNGLYAGIADGAVYSTHTTIIASLSPDIDQPNDAVYVTSLSTYSRWTSEEKTPVNEQLPE